MPVFHYRIALPLLEKSPPADILLAKFRPVRAVAGRDGFLPVNYWLGEDFSGGGRSYNGKTFYGAGDILIRAGYITSVIIFPRANFSWGDILT